MNYFFVEKHTYYIVGPIEPLLPHVVTAVESNMVRFNPSNKPQSGIFKTRKNSKLKFDLISLSQEVKK